MKKTKLLDKLVHQATEASFENGKAVESKVTLFMKSFKNLPQSDAIYALTKYEQSLQRELDKVTLTVTSAVPLKDSQLKSLVSALKSDFLIQNIRTQIDPNIFGGIKLTIGDTVLDDSVASRIQQLEEGIK